MNVMLVGILLNCVYLCGAGNIQNESKHHPYIKIRDCFESDEKDVTKELTGPLTADDPEVTEILRKKYLVPPSTKPYNTKTTLIQHVQASFLLSPKVIAFALDLLIPKMRHGFFVEAGALDGVFLSNTLLLEKNRSWTGLLIEPDPANYRELTKKNRKSWISNSCLSNVPYPKQVAFNLLRKKYQSITDYLTRGATYEVGLSYKNAQMAKVVSAAFFSIHVAQCFPFYSYLLALNRTVVDFLSLDVQGSEWDILRTIPFDKVTIRIIAVEMVDVKMNENPYQATFVKFMNERGYRLIICSGEPDYVFSLRNDPSFQHITHDEPTVCHKSMTRYPNVVKFKANDSRYDLEIDML